MKNEIKKFFTYIGVFISGIFVTLFWILFSRHNRPDVRSIGTGIRDADKHLDSAERNNKDAEESTGKLEQGNRELQDSLERSKQLLKKIRESKIEELPTDSSK